MGFTPMSTNIHPEVKKKSKILCENYSKYGQIENFKEKRHN